MNEDFCIGDIVNIRGDDESFAHAAFMVTRDQGNGRYSCLCHSDEGVRSFAAEDMNLLVKASDVLAMYNL